MKRFGKNKSYTEFLYTKPSLIILIIFIILLSFSVFERYNIERDMSARRVDTEKERQDLLNRKEQLQQKVEYLEGERGIEEEIRKNFDVAREGEQVIILVGDKDSVSTEVQESEPKKFWYMFWK